MKRRNGQTIGEALLVIVIVAAVMVGAFSLISHARRNPAQIADLDDTPTVHHVYHGGRTTPAVIHRTTIIKQNRTVYTPQPKRIEMKRAAAIRTPKPYVAISRSGTIRVSPVPGVDYYKSTPKYSSSTPSYSRSTSSSSRSTSSYSSRR
jgi:hypothetical protein